MIAIALTPEEQTRFEECLPIIGPVAVVYRGDGTAVGTEEV